MRGDGYIKKKKKAFKEKEWISIIIQKLFNYLFIAARINELESLLLQVYECGCKICP